MKKKTEAELKRDQIAKTARTLIRLKHSLKADEELNDLLPDTLEEFDRALAEGQLLELTDSVSAILGDDDITEA